jgi:hypothetical protein
MSTLATILRQLKEGELSDVGRGNSLKSVGNGIYTDGSKDHFYVDFKLKSWLNSELKFFKAFVNEKYDKHQTKTNDYEIDGKSSTRDIAPADYPKDFFVVKVSDLNQHMWGSTYYMDSNSNKETIEKYKQYSDENKKNFNIIASKVGITEVPIQPSDKKYQI